MSIQSTWNQSPFRRIFGEENYGRLAAQRCIAQRVIRITKPTLINGETRDNAEFVFVIEQENSGGLIQNELQKSRRHTALGEDLRR